MALFSPAAATTQADFAFAKLSEDILNCKLAPGAKINIAQVGTRLGISLGGVREALSRLAADGMAIAAAQRGFTVAPISAEELVDLTKTRVAIENLCIRASLKENDLEWEAGLVAAHHRLQRLPEAPPGSKLLSDAWAAHAKFHLALVAGCKSSSLLRIRGSLYAQTERYRRLSLQLSSKARNVNEEHGQLTEAALARDVDRLCELSSEHIWKTTNVILNSSLLGKVKKRKTG
jgi:GntR family carbon starvation induced transcriptional regulator